MMRLIRNSSTKLQDKSHILQPTIVPFSTFLFFEDEEQQYRSKAIFYIERHSRVRRRKKNIERVEGRKRNFT